MKIKFLTIATLISVILMAGCWGKSDADLGKAAADKLKAETTTSGVTVEVKDGVATIKGEVADEAAKAKAAEIAKVEGVKSVTNEVTVKPPAPPAKADTVDKAKIEEALKKGGYNDVTVDTTTTPATLRGTVPKGKLAQAVQAAQQAAGKPLKNEITEK